MVAYLLDSHNQPLSSNSLHPTTNNNVVLVIQTELAGDFYFSGSRSEKDRH